MVLLLDTQVLVWTGFADARLSPVVHDVLRDPQIEFAIGSVTAYEFEDLRIRNRLGPVDTIGVLVSGLGPTLLAFPAKRTALLRRCRRCTATRSIGC